MTEAQHLLGRAVETELWVGDLMFIWGVMQGGDGEPDAGPLDRWKDSALLGVKRRGRGREGSKHR